jgi:glycosyltransferase involved in cell wall biosynthesis
VKTSLIIATYNWPEALELVLLSLLKQSRLPNEIIIADDGSTVATKQLIKRYTDKFQCGLQHIWQTDKGFQKTAILNKAVAKANGDYIIQIDGDIVLHIHFIKDHIQTAQKGTFIHGSRAFLNKKATSKSITNSITSFSIFTNGISNRLNTLRLPFLAEIISSKNKNLKGTRGCNFSFWKKDFVLANGYNEDMKGWGKEDTELSVRLMNNDLQKHKLKGKAVCYHLHHSISSREGLNINTAILETALKNKIKNCTNGINKYAN